MTFCSNCGMELTEGTAFCPNCGVAQVRQFDAPEQPTAEPEAVATESFYQEAAPVYQPACQQPVEASAATLTGAAKIFSIISMASGIASILLCCSGPTFGIAAIIFSILGSKRTPEGVNNTMARVGKITGIIGTVLGVLMIIVSFVSGFTYGYTDSFQSM